MTFKPKSDQNNACLRLVLTAFYFRLAHAQAQRDDDAVLRQTFANLFVAYQNKDLDRVMGMWSVKCPDLYANRQSLQEAFAAYRTISIKNVEFNKITVEGDRATVQLVMTVNVVRLKNDSTNAWKAGRTFQMTKESGSWRILKYATEEDELAARMSAVSSTSEGMALLNAKPELLTTWSAADKQAKDSFLRNKHTQTLSPVIRPECR